MSRSNMGSRLAIVCIAACAVGVLGLVIGSAVAPSDALLALIGRARQPMHASIVFDLRLPRVIAAFAVGGSLALAGVILQALMRNPLADPYVMGVSGGAAVGAVLAMLAGAGTLLTQSAAATGALLAAALVFALGRRLAGAGLLLTGVVFASAAGALVAVLLALADPGQLKGIVFWLLGDLGLASQPLAALAVLLLALAGMAWFAPALNVMAAGELSAAALGLDVRRWRALLFAASAMLTGLAVVTAGMVGFVGLIAPHTVRLAVGTSDHRIVAPVAVISGGALLAAADLLARSALAPRQLPVGAVMALIGAPMFMALLARSAPRRG
ncbi:MAG: iron ABC transporter permease [Steroidobacteraceae bacterium]